MKMIKMKKWQVAIIVAILLLLLCYFMGCFRTEQVVIDTPTTPDVIGSTVSQSSKKLGEHETGSSSIIWDECCSGFITVTLTYSWDWFPGQDVPSDYECDNPVIWTVTDSAGTAKYTSSEDSPESVTTTFRGYWDCMNGWKITVLNGCIPSITYQWTMTMVCD